MKFKSILAILAIGLASCGNDKQSVPAAAPAAKEKAGVVSPFSFYKNIEIRPGLSFEAVAWGKGPDSVGGYSVYLTDTIHNNYKAISGDRKGKLTGFWNLDLDTDGSPEIYLQFTNGNASDLIVYEFEGNDFRKISFPGLSARTKSLFLGNDKFIIRDGSLFRNIPVKSDTGNARSEMKVQYLLQGNSFSIKDAE